MTLSSRGMVAYRQLLAAWPEDVEGRGTADDGIAPSDEMFFAPPAPSSVLDDAETPVRDTAGDGRSPGHGPVRNQPREAGHPRAMWNSGSPPLMSALRSNVPPAGGGSQRPGRGVTWLAGDVDRLAPQTSHGGLARQVTPADMTPGVSLGTQFALASSQQPELASQPRAKRSRTTPAFSEGF